MRNTVVKKNKHIVVLILFAVIAVSCHQKQNLGIQEYAQWVENKDNGLSTTKEIEEFEFKILYKPIDYIIAYELKNQGLNKDSIAARKEQLKGFQYYTLKIKSTNDNEIFKSGIKTEEEYYQRLEYFVGPVQDDISVIDGNDTLPCKVYHFERNYGLSPYNTMVMSFESKETENNKIHDKTFVYDDQVLGTGKIAITISGSDIENLPTLKIN
jgi:hypothetical protein